MIKIPKDQFSVRRWSSVYLSVWLFRGKVKFDLIKRGGSGSFYWETPLMHQSKVKITLHQKATRPILKRTIEEYLSRHNAMKEELFAQIFDD